LRESQLLKQKTPMGYGYISYFLSNRNTIFYEFSWLALHIPSPPACTEDIANRIAKDQYVQHNVPTTTILTVKKNNFNHDTGPHVYDTPDNNDKLVLRILLQDGTLIIEVSDFLKWIFNFQQTNKKNMCLLAYLDRRPQAVDDTRRVASVVRPACLATEV